MVNRYIKVKLRFILIAFLQVGALCALAVTPAFAAVSQGQAIVNAAASQSGQAYCLDGGNTAGPTHGSGGSGCGGSTVGFDCSGLALYSVFQATGITLPHSAAQQATHGGTVINSASNLLPGDLVFFGGGSMSNAEHVGIYAGGGEMWDANDYNVPVQQHSLAWEEAGLAFDGGVRYASAPALTGTATSSQITPDGVQHMYTGDSSGNIYDTSWGGTNNQPLTEWLVTNVGAPVTAISSQVVNGVQNVYVADGSKLADVSWGNGQPVSVWGVTDLGSPIVGLTSQVVNGVQNVDTITATNESNISWGNGQALSVWGIDGVSGVTYTSISSQVTSDGIQHVYAGTSNGSLQDTEWGPGEALTQWGVTNLGMGAILGLTSQVVNGVQNIDAITANHVTNISWSNTQPLSIWGIDSVSGVTYTSVTSQVTPDGIQHVYAGTSNGSLQDTEWGPGEALTQWGVTNVGIPVVGVTSQVVNGVQNVDVLTTSNEANISWSNTQPLSVWGIGTD